MTRPEHCAHGAHRPTCVCIYEHNIPQHFSQFWQHGPCVAGGSRSAYRVVVTSGVAASLYRIIIPHLGHLFELFHCVRPSEHGHFWRDVTLITILFGTAFKTCCNGIRLAQAAQPHVQKTVVISTHFLTMKLSMLTLVSVAGAVHVGLRSTQSICISSDRSRRAILQTKLAVLGVPCEGMCRDVGSYPNCDCPGFDGREVSSDGTAQGLLPRTEKIGVPASSVPPVQLRLEEIEETDFMKQAGLIFLGGEDEQESEGETPFWRALENVADLDPVDKMSDETITHLTSMWLTDEQRRLAERMASFTKRQQRILEEHCEQVEHEFHLQRTQMRSALTEARNTIVTPSLWIRSLPGDRRKISSQVVRDLVWMIRREADHFRDTVRWS